MCHRSQLDAELGNGDVANAPVPVAVSGGRTFASLTVGGFHSCAIHPSGSAYCWGQNTRGELGLGDRNARDQPTPIAGQPVGDDVVHADAGRAVEAAAVLGHLLGSRGQPCRA